MNKLVKNIPSYQHLDIGTFALIPRKSASVSAGFPDLRELFHGALYRPISLHLPACYASMRNIFNLGSDIIYKTRKAEEEEGRKNDDGHLPSDTYERPRY